MQIRAVAVATLLRFSGEASSLTLLRTVERVFCLSVGQRSRKRPKISIRCRVAAAFFRMPAADQLETDEIHEQAIRGNLLPTTNFLDAAGRQMPSVARRCGTACRRIVRTANANQRRGRVAESRGAARPRSCSTNVKVGFTGEKSRVDD